MMVTQELASADAVLSGLSEEKRMVFLMIEGEGLSGEVEARYDGRLVEREPPSGERLAPHPVEVDARQLSR